MAQKTKVVRLPAAVCEKVEAMAADFGIKPSAFYPLVFNQGMQSVRENGIQMLDNCDEKPDIDKESLVKTGEMHAKNGIKSLSDWLNGLTPQEEQAVKYKIKVWRTTAHDIDMQAAIDDLPAIIADGDKAALEGREAFGVWLAQYPKAIQKALQSRMERWIFDSGRSDYYQRTFGRRITESQYEKWKNTAEKDEREFAEKVDRDSAYIDTVTDKN